MKNFDIIICGGGHVGASLALALAQQNIRVALIDDANKTHHDNRVFALSTASQQCLESIHVWSLLQSHITPIEHIHISNKGSFGAARLHAKDFQQNHLGVMVPAVALQQALNTALENSSVTIFSPARLENFVVHDDRVDVFLSQHTITAHWLIGADGIHSFVRKHSSIGMTTKDYQQKALVCFIDLEHSHQFTAYERFVGESAIALLPHTPWQSVLIWSGENAMMDSLISLDEKNFLTELQQAFGYRLGKLMGASPRISYPLVHTQADNIHAKRLLLMGNAAQTLHPIAAQGFNLVLRHIVALTRLLQERHHDNFDQTILDDYVAHQEKDTLRTLRFTDHLIHFSSTSGFVNTKLRSVFINALGASQLAQKYLMDI